MCATHDQEKVITSSPNKLDRFDNKICFSVFSDIEASISAKVFVQEIFTN